MTFDEIMAIIRDKTRTDFQQAADIHAAWAKAAQPSALSIKPKTERKKREPRKPLTTGQTLIVNGSGQHEEAAP